MDIKSISANVGKALLINALFMLMSVGVSIIYGFDGGFTPLLISCLVTMLVGAFPFLFSQGEKHESIKDGYVTIVLSWILSFVFGMLPYVLWGGEFTLANAWFESVSGYTTTGSTILTDIEALPHSLLFWRSSTQFIGGLGVAVFLLLALPDSSQLKLKLSHLELSSIARDGYRYKSSKTVRIILMVYIGMAALESISLCIAGMDIFDSINHAFCTVSTGGFSTRNSSIMHYDSQAIDIIIMVFMALSAMHFGVIYAIFAKRTLRPLGQPITKYYFGVIAVIAVSIALTLMTRGGYGSFGNAALDASFQTISFLSSTGFGQADNSSWPMLANALLLFAAFHGGCAGSTTGGVKANRMLIAEKAIGGEFRKRLSPASVFRIKIGKNFIPEDMVSAVFLFMVLFLMALFVSFVGAVMCGVEVAEAFAGSLASLSNTGPAMGSLGTMGNYAALPDMAKIIFTFDMFFGRLEIIPILIVISMIFKRI